MTSVFDASAVREALDKERKRAEALRAQLSRAEGDALQGDALQAALDEATRKLRDADSEAARLRAELGRLKDQLQVPGLGCPLVCLLVCFLFCLCFVCFIVSFIHVISFVRAELGLKDRAAATMLYICAHLFACLCFRYSAFPSVCRFFLLCNASMLFPSLVPADLGRFRDQAPVL